MSFKMSCPHCKKTLNVPEKAFGKTAPCPYCKGQIEVPRSPPQGVVPIAQAIQPPSPQQPARTTPLPTVMPPLPPTTDDSDESANPLDFLNTMPAAGARAGSHAGAGGAPQSSAAPPYRSNPAAGKPGNPAGTKRFLSTVPAPDLVVDAATAARAKSTIIWSMIVGGVVGGLLLLMSLCFVAEAGPLALLACPGFFLLGCYAGWATFMGWMVVWHWWRNTTKVISDGVGNLGCLVFANPLVLLFLLYVVVACFFYIPLCLASWYGEFGGGLWESVKNWQLANGKRVLVYGKPVQGWQCFVASLVVMLVLSVILALGSIGLAANRPTPSNRMTQPGMSQYERGTRNPNTPSPFGGRRPRR